MSSFCHSLLGELNFEIISTGKLLERVPGDKFDWVPHTKSMRLGGLAHHITQIPRYSRMVLSFETFDVKSPEAVAARVPAATNPKELMERWEQSIADMRTVVAEASDEQLAKTFTLKADENTIFSLPRKIALRTFVLNHLIHHRGQLSVYLRLLDIPIPSIYGPSADER